MIRLNKHALRGFVITFLRLAIKVTSETSLQATAWPDSRVNVTNAEHCLGRIRTEFPVHLIGDELD